MDEWEIVDQCDVPEKVLKPFGGAPGIMDDGRVQLLEDWGVEKWCDDFTANTPKSKFVALTHLMVQKLIAGHEVYNKHGADALVEFVEQHLAEDAAYLAVERLLAEFDGGAFVRLSSRSPKDAAFFLPRTRKELARRLTSSQATPNEQVRALMEASLHSMRVDSASTAFWLICASPRVFMDLIVFERDNGKVSMVLREWVEIPVHTEVRVFIYGGRPTAMGQYFSFLFFPELASEKLRDTWRARILEFCHTHEDALRGKDCVLDVAVLRDQVLMLELNAWGAEITGPGLFHWERDEGQLRGDVPSATSRCCDAAPGHDGGNSEGACLPEFRVRHEAHASLECFEGVTLLPYGWRKVLSELTAKEPTET